MPDISTLTQRNADRWAKAKITRDFGFTAKKLCGDKARYQAIEKRTGVPWFAIAVIHEREASGRFDKQLGQGDPLNQVSTHVPKGRGPFKTFEDGAYDALVNCGPYAAKWKDWTPGGLLCLLEQYNGLGYAARGLPSPYIWSGTDQYVKGKYVRDSVFDPDAVDRQPGCAGLIKAMMALDPTITFAPVTVPLHPPPDAKPVPPQPSPKPSFWAAFLSLLSSIFKRK